MKLSTMIGNAVATSRMEWLRRLLGVGMKDIEKECGHPVTITIEDCVNAYKRGDVAARIVELYPDESWSDDPQLYETEDEKETEFEKTWKELTETTPIFPVLHRADILSGVGRFGVILIGIDDGADLKEPIPNINDRGEITSQGKYKLIYLRPLDESVVKIKDVEKDTSNPRYGQPTSYEIQFSDPSQPATDRTVNAPPAVQPLTVHWSRIVHLTDNRYNSEIYGMPRLERVFNRFLDLKKIAGGSGEMFWKGGFPGISLETQEGADEVDFDKEATKEELQKYMDGLQRYLATTNMTAKSLVVQVADPTPHVTTQLKLIAAAMAVPWRLLMGSESAELASSQDARNWNKRLNRRRNTYLSPYVIRPFVDRLIKIGVLPNPVEGYIIDWGDLNAPSEAEQANVAKVQTEALSKYTSGGVDLLIPPFLFLTNIMGFSDKEAESIVEAAEERQEEVAEEMEEQQVEETEEENSNPRNGNGSPVRR